MSNVTKLGFHETDESPMSPFDVVALEDLKPELRKILYRGSTITSEDHGMDPHWHKRVDATILKNLEESTLLEEQVIEAGEMLLWRFLTFKGVCSPPRNELSKRVFTTLVEYGQYAFLTRWITLYFQFCPGRNKTLVTSFVNVLVDGSVNDDHASRNWKKFTAVHQVRDLLREFNLDKNEDKKTGDSKETKEYKLLTRVYHDLGQVSAPLFSSDLVSHKTKFALPTRFLEGIEKHIDSNPRPAETNHAEWRLSLMLNTLPNLHTILVDPNFVATSLMRQITSIPVDHSGRVYLGVSSDNFFRWNLAQYCSLDWGISLLIALNEYHMEGHRLLLNREGLFDEFEESGILKAVDHFFNYRYEECMMLLFTRIERMLRRTLLLNGISIMNSTKTNSESVFGEDHNVLTLNQLLRKFQSSFSSKGNPAWDMLDYACFLLTQRDGLNLRNRILHGLDDYEPSILKRGAEAALCLHLTMHLATLSFIASDSKE